MEQLTLVLTGGFLPLWKSCTSAGVQTGNQHPSGSIKTSCPDRYQIPEMQLHQCPCRGHGRIQALQVTREYNPVLSHIFSLWSVGLECLVSRLE